MLPLFGRFWSDHDLLTSKSNLFTFVPSSTQFVKLVHFPQAVYKTSVHALSIRMHGHTGEWTEKRTDNLTIYNASITYNGAGRIKTTIHTCSEYTREARKP